LLFGHKKRVFPINNPFHLSKKRYKIWIIHIIIVTLAKIRHSFSSTNKLSMKKVIITGGLGNQMFQYAFALALRSKGIETKLDISYYDFWKKYNWNMHNGYELQDVFCINEECICSQGIHMKWLRLLDRHDPFSIIMKDDNTYHPEFAESHSHYYYGYWQDERYFQHIKKQVQEAFVFQNIDLQNLRIAEEMNSCNSVSLHIRRGDYEQFGMTLMDDSYYQKAINVILQRTSNPTFYIFSDDPVEAKNIAKRMHISYQFIDLNKGKDSYKDMFLMSNCQHNIIANSSFSWWAAWLNNNMNKIVIAPAIWDNKLRGFHPQLDCWELL
jgi:hypothetical protein